MRFLPYALVAAMGAPVLFWIFINNFVIKGQATSFSGSDLVVLGSLGAFMLLAFFFLSTWMHRHIAKTPG